jgi:hypothetical protein
MRAIPCSNRGHAVADTHRHTWQTSSRHHTSDGTVSYQRCHCGLWSVLLEPSRGLATIPPDNARPRPVQTGHRRPVMADDEVAPSVVEETIRAWRPAGAERQPARLRTLNVGRRTKIERARGQRPTIVLARRS